MCLKKNTEKLLKRFQQENQHLIFLSHESTKLFLENCSFTLNPFPLLYFSVYPNKCDYCGAPITDLHTLVKTNKQKPLLIIKLVLFLGPRKRNMFYLEQDSYRMHSSIRKTFMGCLSIHIRIMEI